MANLRVDKITSTETFETTGSVQFDGSGDYLRSTTNLSDYQFGTGDFTVEAWIYKSANGSNNYDGICTYGTNGSADDGWFFEVSATRGYVFWIGGNQQISFNESPNTNQWIHTSVIRESGVVRLFVNGVLKKEVSILTSVPTTGTSFDIGAYAIGPGNFYFNGFISNVRVVKGTALYTSNFKPPMRELEVVPGTVLLACQSKTDASLEKTGKVITVNGNAVANELTPGILTPVPKAGAGSAITGSVEFTGSPSKLTVGSASDWTFLHNGTTHTVECWFNSSEEGNAPITDLPLINTAGTPSAVGFGLFISSGTNGNVRANFYKGSGDALIAQSPGSLWAVNTWNHLAAVYDSSTNYLTVYLNGVDVVSTDGSSYAFSSADPTYTLALAGNQVSSPNYSKVFISNARIVKGTALYTNDFIPPTRELKKVPGTVLLCCQDSNDPTQEVTGKTISLNGIYTYDTVVTSGITTAPGPSNFTPQVGDDRQITFEGVTKIDTDAYFYLPTGNTESRDKGAGTRGISFGGSDASNRLNTISYINISTTGNAKDFGDLLDKINQGTAAASSTRGISAGGFGTSPTSNEIDTVNYITMASTGDAIDFGNLTVARRLLVGCSSQIRGIFAGGYDAPNKYNTMDYITIASTGDAIDFGDMVADGQTASGRYSSAGYASPTRGVWHGGYGYPAYRNIIDYVTIASKGNTKDFGDSAITNYYMGGCSNSIRGISGGAYNPSPAHLNLIEYTTIATTGDAKDFGDLIQKATSTGACASKIRGVFLGAVVGGSRTNNISYVTLMSMGNALDFGDLTSVNGYNAGCSNGHGGLG